MNKKLNITHKLDTEACHKSAEDPIPGCTCACEAEGSVGSMVARRGSSTDQYAAAKGTSFASVTPMPRQKLRYFAKP